MGEGCPAGNPQGNPSVGSDGQLILPPKKYTEKMNRWLLIITLLMPFALLGQDEDPMRHRGVQFAAQGTDFWVCFPRTLRGMSPNHSQLHVVCEHDCDVTVTNERLDYRQTYHVMGRRMCGPDTNFIEIPFTYTRIIDTVPYVYLATPSSIIDTFPRNPRQDYRGVPGDLPQPRGFHVTSTDTISLFLVVASNHQTACTVLPTELLRDEYVALPPIVYHHPQLGGLPRYPYYMPGMSSIDIVAVEDSTVVDIVTTDWDWLNRPPGSSVTVTLQRGELFHLSAGEPPEKYYPMLAPYYDPNHATWNSPVVVPVPVERHTFFSHTDMLDTFAVDMAGTHIKARDCKRIAVFESSGSGGSGSRGVASYNVKIEQSVPIFFAGQEFFVDLQTDGTDNFIRFTALDEETHVTIQDMAHPGFGSRQLTIAPGKTDWWNTAVIAPPYYDSNDVEGPFYITSDRPVLAKWFGTGLMTLTPTRWWHWGQINFNIPTYVYEDHNRNAVIPNLHLYVRTEDVNAMYMDYYRLESYFQPIEGTPYSHASFGRWSQFTTEGTHHIVNRNGGPFAASLFSIYYIPLPHVQPGGTMLTVNGQLADSLTADSLWCVNDPVLFQASNRRPCDSLLWDFGDGTNAAFSCDDEGFNQPLSHLFQRTGRITVRAIFKYADEGCFTLKQDTVSVTMDIRGDVDTLLPILVCEGNYLFRGHELDTSGMYEITTSWPSGSCDTLWRIDFTTCPHCRWVRDTVSTDDMPVTFNGRVFGAEQYDTPIHLNIGDTCDSIIYYTLIAIPNWGEPPIDSTWVLAPNVFAPGAETNNRFALTCSPHILKADVTVFDRRGIRVAQFDGMTGSWDGTVNAPNNSSSGGTPAPQGTYVYYIRYMDTHDASWKTLTGTVTLLR